MEANKKKSGKKLRVYTEEEYRSYMKVSAVKKLEMIESMIVFLSKFKKKPQGWSLK